MYKSNKQATPASPDRRLQIGSITEEELTSQIPEIEEWVEQEPDTCRLRDFRDRAVSEIAQHGRTDISKILSPLFTILYNRIARVLKAKRSSGESSAHGFRIVSLVSDTARVSSAPPKREVQAKSAQVTPAPNVQKPKPSPADIAKQLNTHESVRWTGRDLKP